MQKYSSLSIAGKKIKMSVLLLLKLEVLILSKVGKTFFLSFFFSKTFVIVRSK